MSLAIDPAIAGMCVRSISVVQASSEGHLLFRSPQRGHWNATKETYQNLRASLNGGR
jgi:hypothetical protein